MLANVLIPDIITGRMYNGAKDVDDVRYSGSDVIALYVAEIVPVKEESCPHKRTGTRYLFTPSRDKKVVAVMYCKDCGAELSREVVRPDKTRAPGKKPETQ